ncbi:6214_t:CDS:2 [Paraglomus occultum]|uniref:6214_t:CDS:1 n=1 Tax=Paraglomus occultum TaxID=144539 RepID=A0A9N8VS55_9GLOM|nr:6214_t:CDS:2 [Paraglomus occultum]
MLYAHSILSYYCSTTTSLKNPSQAIQSLVTSIRKRIRRMKRFLTLTLIGTLHVSFGPVTVHSYVPPTTRTGSCNRVAITYIEVVGHEKGCNQPCDIEEQFEFLRKKMQNILEKYEKEERVNKKEKYRENHFFRKLLPPLHLLFHRFNMTNANENTHEPSPHDRIVLNVGGVKYETYRSTLTAYPDTLLGRMFQTRNAALLHPTNGNEYFIDRDGHVFRHILQFYRTGELHYSDDPSQNPCSTMYSAITRKEIDTEIDYFQIPVGEPLKLGRLVRQAMFDKVDDFIEALKNVIYVVLSNFKRQVSITFYEDEMDPVVDDLNSAYVGSLIYNIILPFRVVGFLILDKLGDEIGKYFENNNKELKWDAIRDDDYKISVVLKFEFKHVAADEIIRNTCLSSELATNDS